MLTGERQQQQNVGSSDIIYPGKSPVRCWPHRNSSNHDGLAFLMPFLYNSSPISPILHIHATISMANWAPSLVLQTPADTHNSARL
jgi:hypothetical protein